MIDDVNLELRFLRSVALALTNGEGPTPEIVELARAAIEHTRGKTGPRNRDELTRTLAVSTAFGWLEGRLP